MKKLLLLACCLTTMGIALAQDNNQKEPTFNNKVIPEPRVFDFGLIKEDQGPVSHKFLLKNTSNKPIAISEVHAWCGCTTAEFTKKAILPGKSGEVNVAVYPEGTRSKTGDMLPFHNGVFKIAQKARVPIVVLSARGAENIRGNFPLRHTDIYLGVCAVIPPEEHVPLPTAEVSARVRELLEADLAPAHAVHS